MVNNMNKQKKAKKIIDDDLIFVATENDRIILYVCKGISGKVYEIFYDKEREIYKCACNNVKLNTCYHMVAAHYLRTGEWLT